VPVSTLHDRRGPVRHTSPRRRAGAIGLLPYGLGILLSLLVAVPVLGHADLKTSNPKDGAVLATPPTTISLTFTEGLDAGKSSIRVNGPGGLVGTAKPSKDGAATITLDGLSLGPGAYTVKWTSAALDGHIERGSISFTVSEPTPAPATATPAPTEAASAAASDTPSAAPTDAPASVSPATDAPTDAPASAAASPAASAPPAQPASSGSGTDVLIPIIVGLVIVGGVGAFVLRRSRGA
jgi:copper resistance protein C